MYRYHGSTEHEKRLVAGRCRCESQGEVHNLPALLREGRINDPHQMENTLSTPEVRRSRSEPDPGGGYGKTFIFAVSEDFEIHIAPDSDRALEGAVKHETLFHNADVLAAGEICIRDGIIAGLNDLSGSYGTDGALETNPGFADAALLAFDKHGLPVREILKDELGNLRSV
jgi:hypothetical protein